MIGQCHKAVTKAARNHQLALILLAQLNRDPLLVGRAGRTQVNGHIEDRAARTAHELCLCLVTALKMNAAQRALHGRGRVVVLHEIVVQTGLLKCALGPAFHKKSAMVAEHLWLNNDNAVDFRFDNLHTLTLLISNFSVCYTV